MATHRIQIKAIEPVQVVGSLRHTMLDGMELLRLVKNELVLVDRGGIPLMRVLGHAYDGPNVTALEVEMGATRFLNVRKLDKALELRLQAAWRKAILQNDLETERPLVRLCVVTVVS